MSGTPTTKTEEIVIARRSALTVEFKLRNPSTVPSKAVLVIKENLADADSLALVTLTVFQAANADGVITASTGSAPVLRFLISETDSENLVAGKKYYSALKVWPTGGAPYSPPGGRRGVRVVAEGVFATA